MCVSNSHDQPHDPSHDPSHDPAHDPAPVRVPRSIYEAMDQLELMMNAPLLCVDDDACEWVAEEGDASV